MKRVHIIIKGDVQGVLFRAHTRKVAAELGINGYVKNLPDRNVEVIAEGNEKALEKLIEFCKPGPAGADVKDIEIKFEKPKNEFDSFEIRY